MTIGTYLDLEKIFENWRGGLKQYETTKRGKKSIRSSNVKRMVYDDTVDMLVIEFHDLSKYTYGGITLELFNKLTGGEAVCITSGKNKFGKWWVGKTPSVGAAVYQLLVKAGVDYIKGDLLGI